MLFTSESRKVNSRDALDLDNIPLFGRNASKFCYLKVIKSKKTVKQMYFIKKKKIPYPINFPSLSKDNNNLNQCLGYEISLLLKIAQRILIFVKCAKGWYCALVKYSAKFSENLYPKLYRDKAYFIGIGSASYFIPVLPDLILSNRPS